LCTNFFRISLLAIALLFSDTLYGQKIAVNYEFSSPYDSLLWPTGYQQQFNNKSSLLSYLEARQQDFYRKGYLLASIDVQNMSDSLTKAKVGLGRKIELVALDVSQVSKAILLKSGFKEQQQRLHLKPSQFIFFKEELLEAASNCGYPFARVTLKNSKIGRVAIQADCILIPGNKIYFDSLSVKGTNKIKNDFLAKYLGLKGPKKSALIYRQHLVDDIGKKISELPYISLEKPPKVLFKDDRATVQLILREEKVNKLDGMIGLIPSNGTRNGTQLNGYINLDLQNPFGRGKKLLLRWTRAQRLSPIFEFEYHHPQLLKSSLNAHLKLSSIQQDSLFRNLQWQLGIDKRLVSGGAYGFFYRRNQSIGLSTNINLDYNLPINGLRLHSDFIGIFHGSSSKYGNKCKLNYSLGFGKTALSGIDSLSTVNNRLIMSLGIEKSFNLSKTFAFVGQLRSEWVTGEDLFVSEVFRVGGFNSLRGFDENLYYTSLYFLLRNDFRVYLENQSYLYVFADFAALEQLSLQNRAIVEWTSSIGFGLGLNLKVRQGLLKLASGLGINGDNKLTLKKARFHFGYTAVF